MRDLIKGLIGTILFVLINIFVIALAISLVFG